MAAKVSEKSYAVTERYCNFFSGGDVAWSVDGSRIYCLNTTEVTSVDVATGQVLQAYSTSTSPTTSQNKSETEEVDEDVIYSFALALSDEFLASAHRSGLLRMWELQTGKVVKLWKSQHKGPVVKLQFSNCTKLLCSSGADSTLRIWDFANSSCVAVLRDFSGPALLLRFHPNEDKHEIFAAGADNTVYCWNYDSKTLVQKLRGHLSQVTGLSFQNDASNCEFLATVSRDKVLILWRLEDGTQHKVIPMYEELEGVCVIPNNNTDAMDVIVASAKGNLKLVDCRTAKITTLLEGDATTAEYEFKTLLHCKQTQQLAVITAEQNILIFALAAKTNLECVKQLIGFNDEILDLCFLGENDRYLTMATNSKNIKIYDTSTQMNAKIVAGHNDTVMSLSTASGSNFLLSAGKDFSIFLWEIDTENFDLKCVAKNCSSHTATIGCVSFGCNTTSIFASVCQDGSFKVWHLKQQQQQETTEAAYAFSLKYAALAHEKEVNSVSFAPNNKMLATASQDKTAKLWSTQSHTQLGTLRGHTRGVWCVRFSPVDQIVLTSSSDCSLRIWALSNMSCLKRFEQDSTVLCSEFFDQGKYIVSASSDGLLKIWNIKTNACVQTLDEHTNRVWALAVSTRSNKHFYTGGADSKLIKWHDITTQSRNVEIEKRQVLLLQEQQLQSLLQEQQNMRKALLLALTLGKPKISYNIFSSFVKRRDDEAIKSVITQLNADQRNALQDHIKIWCSNSRTSNVANIILQHILKDILANPGKRLYNTHSLVEKVLPYVDRHFRRMTELTKDLSFLDFVAQGI